MAVFKFLSRAARTQDYSGLSIATHQAFVQVEFLPLMAM
jgi:hypothetical protein